MVVVVNQNSTNSLQLGNYYCEQRGVPPQNLLRVNWLGGNTNWTKAEFESILRAPLNSMLTTRGLSNQIECVVLCMDIPYRVIDTSSAVSSDANGTTSALYYGFKPNPSNPYTTCSLAAGSTSAYAGSEGIYRQTPPINASSSSWLTILLTATNLAKAKALVDLGRASDATFPTQTVFLAKSSDSVRNLRHLQADNAILNTRLRGNYHVVLTNVSSPLGLGPMLGFQNGVQIFEMSSLEVSPGAMMDNLTSFGGFLFEYSEHTTAMDFINNGATASYGTVVEPCAYEAKFPDPQNYFFQARGFSVAESYYQSLANPYQGVLVGEPLAAPFAVSASGNWIGLAEDTVLAGVTNLNVQFVSPNPDRPIQQVDLFLDGQFLHTVTNIAPRQNNVLSATLNGFTANYTIPAAATIKSVTSALVSQLNSMTFSNSTQVAAVAHGDRIELQSLNLNTPGANVTVSVSNAVGSAALLTTYLTASRSNFLDTPAAGLRQFSVAVRRGGWGLLAPDGYADKRSNHSSISHESIAQQWKHAYRHAGVRAKPVERHQHQCGVGGRGRSRC
ncbi:MAG: TIGR03790 family protein [Verrucomicrobiota bacterium]